MTRFQAIEDNQEQISDSRPPVSRDRVARRAYELFLARGQEHGHDMNDWLQAEQELESMPDDGVIDPGDLDDSEEGSWPLAEGAGDDDDADSTPPERKRRRAQ
jgi:hypothetical protein